MFVFKWAALQARILKNYYRKNKLAFFLKDLWHTLILLFGLALFYFFLNLMFGFIERKGLPSFDFAFILLSFSLLILMPLIFYSAVVSSLSFLFQREEIQFYFSLPIKKVSIFMVKFLQTYFYAIWMVFLALLVFLFALQSYFKTTLLIYITGSISFLVFLFIPVSLAVILVIIISRFVSFVQAKGILVVIGLFVGSSLVAAIRVMQPERLATASGRMRLITFVEGLHKPWMTALPSEWVTNLLFAQIQNDLKGIAYNFFALIFLALVLAILLALLAKLFYHKIWAEAAVASPSAGKGFAWQIILRIFPISVRTFVRKDLLSFYRNTVEKGSLLILIPLGFVYLFSIYVLNRQIQSAMREAIFSFFPLFLFSFLYCSVIISGLCGRWVFPSVSVEGNNFKLIKGSPISLDEFLRAKFFIGLVPLLFLGEVLILLSSFILGLRLPFILISLLTMIVLCFGITLIALIVGVREADFSIKDTLEYALSYKGFLTLIWEGIFVVMIVFFVGVPTGLFLRRGFSQPFILSLVLSLSAVFVILRTLYLNYKSSLQKLAKVEI